MQGNISAKTGKGLSTSQARRQHISDSQFRFSYDPPAGMQNRPLTVPVWAHMGDVGQPAKLKRSHSRRPDGNPVTGEGYEPQHYRPSYYGPLNVFVDAEKLPAQEMLSPKNAGGRVQEDSSPLVLNSPLRPIVQRPASASGRKRIPPGGYSDGLW